MKKTLATLLLLTLTSACSSTPAPKMQSGSHELMPKIALDVQTISLADHSPASSTTIPFQPNLAEAIHQWAADRFQAVGSSGQAIIIVKDASFVEQTLPKDSGLVYWFKRQQASKYVAHIEVEIDVEGHDGSGTITGQANRFASMPENPSTDERKTAYFEVLNGVMRDLGTNVENAMHEHLSNYVITAPMMGNGMAQPQGSAP